MKKFKYKFQSILNVKEMEERQLQEEYSLLKKAHLQTLQVLDSLERNRQKQFLELQKTEGQGSIDLTNALLYRDYLNHLKREIELEKEEEKKRREELESGYQRLIDKTKERKIFEKLKEKHKTNFIYRQLQFMQKDLDDLAQGRFNYQKKSIKAEVD